jgi:hypothetical protein
VNVDAAVDDVVAESSVSVDDSAADAAAGQQSER